MRAIAWAIFLAGMIITDELSLMRHQKSGKERKPDPPWFWGFLFVVLLVLVVLGV